MHNFLVEENFDDFDKLLPIRQIFTCQFCDLAKLALLKKLSTLNQRRSLIADIN